MKYEVRFRSMVFLLIIVFSMIYHLAHAQKLNECQKYVDELVKTFNQSIEEDRVELIRSTDYLKKLKKLRDCLTAYQDESYGLSDSIQRINNEAVYLALATKYAKSLYVLRDLSLNGVENENVIYNRGQLNILNRKYKDAEEDFKNTIQMPFSDLNLLAAVGLGNEKNFDFQNSSSSSDSRYYYNQSVLLVQNGKIDEALNTITQAISLEDKNRYRILRGWLNLEQNKAELAKQDFEKISSSHSIGDVGLGYVYLAQSNYKKAKKQFLVALESSNKKNANRIFLGLGQAHYGLGEYDEALKQLINAKRFSPENVSLLTGIGDIYYSKKNYRAAKKYYDESILRDSTFIPAYIGRAIVNYLLGDFELAKTDFQKSEISTEYSTQNQTDWYTSKGYTFYFLRDFDQAMLAFKKALELDPMKYEAHVGISNILIKQKKFPQAGERLVKAIEMAPSVDALSSNYGNLLLHFGMFEKAESNFRKALEINPKNLAAWNGLSITHLEKDQISKSIILLDSLIKKNPTKSYLYNNRGVAQIYMGNRAAFLNDTVLEQYSLKKAKVDVGKALSIDSTKKFYHVNLGNVYRFTKDYQLAEAHYRIHLDKSAVNNLGVLFAGINRLNDSKYYFDIAMQIDSSSRILKYNMIQLLNRESLKSVSPNANNEDEISIKYSKDGYVSINLYDYEFDEPKFQSSQQNVININNSEKFKFIPKLDLRLEAYTSEQKIKKKAKFHSNNKFKFKLPKIRKNNIMACPNL